MVRFLGWILNSRAPVTRAVLPIQYPNAVCDGVSPIEFADESTCPESIRRSDVIQRCSSAETQVGTKPHLAERNPPSGSVSLCRDGLCRSAGCNFDCEWLDLRRASHWSFKRLAATDLALLLDPEPSLGCLDDSCHSKTELNKPTGLNGTGRRSFIASLPMEPSRTRRCS